MADRKSVAVATSQSVMVLARRPRATAYGFLADLEMLAVLKRRGVRRGNQLPTSKGSKCFTFFSPSHLFRSPVAMDLACVCGRPHCLKGVNTAPRVKKTCHAKKAPLAKMRVRRRKWAPVVPVDDEGPNPFEAFRNPAVVVAHAG